MPIKDINQIIRQGIDPRCRERFSERLERNKPKPNPKYSSMSEVVPPLNRGDFLRTWREDRAQLEKVRKERDKAVEETKKLRGMLNKGR